MIRKLSPSSLLSVDFSTKRMRALEWALVAAAILYAIWDPHWIWITFAALALVLTAINPTAKLQKSMRSRFVKPPRTPVAKPAAKE